jgi:hypothetical protein
MHFMTGPIRFSRFKASPAGSEVFSYRFNCFGEVQARLVFVQVVYRSIGLRRAAIRYLSHGEY